MSDLQHRKDYPVQWKDKTYYLSDLTMGIKRAYAKWLARDMIANAKAIMDHSDFVVFRETLMASPPRWEIAPTPVVAASFGSHNLTGHIALNRLMLGVTPEEMSDEEIETMIREKDADQSSDYSVAMRMILDAYDPK